MNSEKQFYSLPRKIILKKTLEIKQVLENGKRFKGQTINIFLQVAEERRFAVLVTKRIGNAVKRNRMKRLIREIYRKNPNWFKGMRVVVYVKKFNSDYRAIEKEFINLLKKS